MPFIYQKKLNLPGAVLVQRRALSAFRTAMRAVACCQLSHHKGLYRLQGRGIAFLLN